MARAKLGPVVLLVEIGSLPAGSLRRKKTCFHALEQTAIATQVSKTHHQSTNELDSSPRQIVDAWGLEDCGPLTRFLKEGNTNKLPWPSHFHHLFFFSPSIRMRRETRRRRETCTMEGSRLVGAPIFAANGKAVRQVERVQAVQRSDPSPEVH